MSNILQKREQKEMHRCHWVNLNNPLYVKYHDEEWGKPLHDDRALFELLILEEFQAGLSWETVLNKREAFRAAFDGFVPEIVAHYQEGKINELMQNSGIIRNRRKITASIQNARVFLEIATVYDSFDRYIWSFTHGQTIREPYSLRTTSPLSDQIAADLKKRGMHFIGSTIMYSFLQAAGILQAHGEECDLGKISPLMSSKISSKIAPHSHLT